MVLGTMTSFKRCIAPVAVAASLAACGTPPHPSRFGSDWKPVNTYTSGVRAIALSREHVFAASPLDGSLRGLLARWALEAGMSLDYRSPYDYSLSVAAGSVQHATLTEAVRQLNQVYAASGVTLMIAEGGRTLVLAPTNELGATNAAAPQQADGTPATAQAATPAPATPIDKPASPPPAVADGASQVPQGTAKTIP